MGNVNSAVLIAGTGSGVGKTSVSLGLCGFFQKKGFVTRPFKTGPDFIDPTHLSIAAQNVCYNLDTWMCGPDYVRELFEKKSSMADISVVEGVMGLFDGASINSHEGSAASLALLLNLPVLLVVNAGGFSRSIAALVKGFTEFEKDLKIAGIVANNIGSAKHGELLKAALKEYGLPPLVGAVPRGGFPEFSSRHLGLVNADEENLSSSVLDQLVDSVEKYFDTDFLLSLAKPSENTLGVSKDSFESLPKPLRIGVAKDEAFFFYYPDALEELEREGAELVFFSPVHDGSLPENLHGVFLGGGYPELFARELSRNVSMLDSLRSFAKNGGRIYAECGGLLYLSNSISTRDGVYPMCGIFPVDTGMNNRFTNLGYVDVTLQNSTFTGLSGDSLRGHRFHYSHMLNEPGESWKALYSVTGKRTQKTEAEGWSNGNILATYVHLNLASNRNLLQHFIAFMGGANER